MIEWSLIASNIASVAFDIIYFGLIISTILVVVLDNRNPVKTIAWILVLMFLPVVGLILYFFFGRNQRKERIIGEKSYSKLLNKSFNKYQSQHAYEVPSKYASLIQFCKLSNQAFPFESNRVEIYTNGYDKIHSLIRELYKAKKHIHFEYYIFIDDAIGRLIRDVLIDKSKEGVEVRVIYDDVGSWTASNEFFNEMRDAGIEVRSFLKVRFPPFTSKVNYRNHRKIVVIDGCVGFIGGMNIAERYVTGVSWGGWRDTHILIEGKAVYGLQTIFLLDWAFVDQTLITDKKYFPPIDVEQECLMQVVSTNPVSRWKNVMQAMVQAILLAREYIYIQTPYFLPTEPISNALQTAALSGVDVRLMLPEKSDSKLVHWGSRSYIDGMLQAGVKVYFYQKGFLHAKTIVSDDLFATIGTTNIDFRSFEHNFEVNSFIYNEELAEQLKDIFIEDQHGSTQLFLKNWEQRPIGERMLESIVRLFSPLL